MLNTNARPGLRERLRATLLTDARWPTQCVLTIAGALIMLLALPPNPCGLLAGVALVPLLFAFASATTTSRAFLCGWLFGTLLVALAIGWLEPALQRFGEFPSWLSWALYALVMSQSGLTLGLFAALLFRVRRRRPAWPMALLAPVLLTTAEFIVPRPFDWNIGVTVASHPWITQVADITGVIGLSFLIAMVNGALFDSLAARLRSQALPWRSLACTLTLIAASLGYSQYRIADIDARRSLAPALRIGAVQGNISLDDGSDPDLAPQRLRRYLDKSQQLVRRGAELIIWPETAYPYFLTTSPRPGETEEIARTMRELGVPLLAGMVSEGSATPGTDFDLYNSAYLIAADGRIQGRYDKHLLFPVREYIPLGDYFPALNDWFAPRYSAGAQRTILPLGPHRIGPLICYEDIQPGFVRDLAPSRPNLLVTLSNDTWFGPQAARQHMALSVFRSIEMRLDMVRVSTNGVSAIIDAAGRVTVQTRAVDPEALPGVQAFGLTGTVAMLDGGDSFHARYGPVFAWLNLLATLALLVLPAVSREVRHRPRADAAA